VPDRVVFDHVIAALVHGSGYERIAERRPLFAAPVTSGRSLVAALGRIPALVSGAQLGAGSICQLWPCTPTVAIRLQQER
jgi:hypothetical protein